MNSPDLSFATKSGYTKANLDVPIKKDIPKYTEIDIQNKLGEGASGVVFKASSKKDPTQLFALKKVEPIGYSENEALKEEIKVSMKCKFCINK